MRATGESTRSTARATELAARDALSRLASAPPGARELGLLSREDLAALVAATALVARADPGSRALVALDAARRFTGSAGGELREGARVLATAGSPGENAFSVAQGDLSLVLSAPVGRVPAAREELLARALLAHVSFPGEQPASGAARVLAMLERVLAAGLELERLVTVATDLAVEATGAGRGFLLLREPGSKLGFRAARRAGDDLVDPAGIVSRSLVREVFLSGRALLLADAASDPERKEAESVGSRGLRSVLVAPIPSASEDEAALGVLYLDDPGAVGRFGPAESEVAVGFAARLGPPLRSVLERESEQRAAASARRALSRPQTRPRTKYAYPELVGTGARSARCSSSSTGRSSRARPSSSRARAAPARSSSRARSTRNGPRQKGPFERDLVRRARRLGPRERAASVTRPGAFTGAAQARKGDLRAGSRRDDLPRRAPGGEPEAPGRSPPRPRGAARSAPSAPTRRQVDVRLVAATNATSAPSSRPGASARTSTTAST